MPNNKTVPKDFEEDDGGCDDDYGCIDTYDYQQMIDRLKRTGEIVSRDDEF